MDWAKFFASVLYVALSGALGAGVMGSVFPETLSDWKKLGTVMGFGAAKDVYLLLTNVNFRRKVGVDYSEGEEGRK